MAGNEGLGLSIRLASSTSYPHLTWVQLVKVSGSTGDLCPAPWASSAHCPADNIKQATQYWIFLSQSAHPRKQLFRRRVAMQRRVFFASVFLTLLVFAHAQAEETFLDRVQDYVQQAAQQAQDALTSVQESQVAKQAKGWMAEGFTSLHDYWSTWTDKFSGLWEKSEKAVKEIPERDAP
ncbi:apolipoprotein C-III [Dromiciops gliroides]|uniref:apolipoprotein C-III n=1 Tax=Dromiciops gliroides TaxID=33562 RepID=UPI001CC46F4C|nr:apolipoprotein C-III [Dromiciops gliroides]